MASISSDANGTKRLLFSFEGKRRTIRLGRISKKQAEIFRNHIETLISAKAAKLPIPVETAVWINGLSNDISEKLSTHGLIPLRSDANLVDYIDERMRAETSVADSTKEIWRQTSNNLREHFGAKITLRSLDGDLAKGFKGFLVQKGYRPYTIRKHIMTARRFLNEAVEKKLIPENPFLKVRAPVKIDLATRKYVPAEVILKIMESAPDAQWRALIALTRFGGLRCPSEVLSLRWANVDWAGDRIVVDSPKTAHMAGGEQRIIPFFPELRQPLQDAWERAEEGDEFVIQRYRYQALTKNGWRNSNLRTSFAKIIIRTGFLPWPRLFHALRASCETDLMDRFPLPTVTQWIGNTPIIAIKHYGLAKKEHYDQAIQAVPTLEPDKTPQVKVV